MDTEDILIWGLVGAVGYWAYRNGFGALVGVCPPGYSVAQDLFPTCRNNFYTAGANIGMITTPGPLGTSASVLNPDPAVQAIVKSRPETSLPFPQVWGWNGSAWVAVNENAQWP